MDVEHHPFEKGNQIFQTSVFFLIPDNAPLKRKHQEGPQPVVFRLLLRQRSFWDHIHTSGSRVLISSAISFLPLSLLSIYIYIYALKLKQANLHKEWYVDSGWFSVCVPFIYQHSKNASKVETIFWSCPSSPSAPSNISFWLMLWWNFVVQTMSILRFLPKTLVFVLHFLIASKKVPNTDSVVIRAKLGM